jgi:hypothetical protein
VGKHLSMVKENIMKLWIFFYGTNNYPCMVKENRMKIIDDFLLWKKNWV